MNKKRVTTKGTTKSAEDWAAGEIVPEGVRAKVQCRKCGSQVDALDAKVCDGLCQPCKDLDNAVKAKRYRLSCEKILVAAPTQAGEWKGEVKSCAECPAQYLAFLAKAGNGTWEPVTEASADALCPGCRTVTECLRQFLERKKKSEAALVERQEEAF